MPENNGSVFDNSASLDTRRDVNDYNNHYNYDHPKTREEIDREERADDPANIPGHNHENSPDVIVPEGSEENQHGEDAVMPHGPNGEPINNYNLNNDDGNSSNHAFGRAVRDLASSSGYTPGVGFNRGTLERGRIDVDLNSAVSEARNRIDRYTNTRPIR